MSQSKVIARAKFHKALALIERAQHLLSDACQELSPLTGAVDQWKLVGKHYDQVHQLWRDVAYSGARNIVDLDSDNKAKLVSGQTNSDQKPPAGSDS